MMINPYDFGVLQKDHHERLVADLEGYARDAGIQPHWIYQPLLEAVGPQEKAYLREFRRHRSSATVAGLCYVGAGPLSAIVPRMSALAGCLTRNFVRARLMNLGAVLTTQDDRLSDYSCLLIPNFFVAQEQGGHLAAWQISWLLDVLIARRVSGLQTVLYVQNLPLLEKQYGKPFRDLIETTYLQVGV